MSEEPKEDETPKLSEEEITELQEKAAKADELTETLKEKEEALSKLESKDFNFRKFEKAKDEEKEEMLSKFNKKEQMMINEMSEIKGELSANKQARLDEAKETFLMTIGDDDDLKKKLEDAVKRSNEFRGEPKTAQETIERYQLAYESFEGKRLKVNPTTAFSPVTGHIDSPGREKRFTDTKQGKADFERWFKVPVNKKDK